MQVTFSRVVVRKCRHALHFTTRNRNVLIADCHLYENSGIGVFYDEVNIHQTNIVGSHISYNGGGGVVSRGGNVRNLHIGTCDIEGNHNSEGPPSANIELTSTGGSIGEVAITGCTVQHSSKAPGSANIRIQGAGNDPNLERRGGRPTTREGNVTISANVFSDVRVNIEVRESRGVVISGNTFWEGFDRDLIAENCEHLIVSDNNFDRNPRYAVNGFDNAENNGLLFKGCTETAITGNIIGGVWRQRAAVDIENGNRMMITNNSIFDSDGIGLRLEGVTNSIVANNLIRDDREEAKRSKEASLVVIGGKDNEVNGNLLGNAKFHRNTGSADPARNPEGGPLDLWNEATRSNNAFCFSLLAQKDAAKGNHVFSPFSIWSALAMTSAGAEAETLQQMQKVLSLPANDSHALVSAWSAKLKQSKDVQMKVANRLWGRQGLPFRPEFLKLTEKEYGAALQPLDFAGHAEEARLEINQWLSDNTEGKIKDLLDRGMIRPDTQLVLTNAIYFKGAWKIPFNANATAKRDFTLASGKKTTPETMRGEFPAAYMEDDRLQAVRLPYKGADMAMLLVRPKHADALTGPPFLDAAGFAQVLSALKDEKSVVVQLPKFEASAKIELAETLSQMGMPRAFTDDAQFGRLCAKRLKISAVIHQAWIKVAEKGTEAAAATAVVMMPGSARMEPKTPPKTFIADHPFLFFVIDARNGGIVFAGQVMDPEK
jgi:serine protease inhibitor